MLSACVAGSLVFCAFCAVYWYMRRAELLALRKLRSLSWSWSARRQYGFRLLSWRKLYVGLQSWFWCPLALRRGRSLSQVYWACGSGGASLCVVVAVAVVGSTICVVRFAFCVFSVLFFVRLCVPILSGGLLRNVGFL